MKNIRAYCSQYGEVLFVVRVRVCTEYKVKCISCYELCSGEFETIVLNYLDPAGWINLGEGPHSHCLSVRKPGQSYQFRL